MKFDRSRFLIYTLLTILIGSMIITLESVTDYYDLKYIERTSGFISPLIFDIFLYNVYNWIPWIILSFLFYPDTSLINVLSLDKRKSLKLILKVFVFLAFIPLMASVLLEIIDNSQQRAGIWSDYTYSFLTNLYKYIIGLFLLITITVLIEFYQNYGKIEDSLSEINKEKNKLIVKLKNMNSNDQPSISIKIGQKIKVLKLKDITWFESNDYYVNIYCKGKSYLYRESIKALENRLPSQFIRIHRGSIINLNFLDRIEQIDKNQYALLSDGTKVLIAKTRYSNLKSKLGSS